MTRKIIPVTPDTAGRIVARKPVLNVFDTNGDGELMEVAFRRNAVDPVEVWLRFAPYKQVYVEIDE